MSTLLEQYSKIRRALRLYLRSPKNGLGKDKPVMRAKNIEDMDELYLDGVYYCLFHSCDKDVFGEVNIGELIDEVGAGGGEVLLAVLKEEYGISDFVERLQQRNSRKVLEDSGGLEFMESSEPLEHAVTLLDIVIDYIKTDERDGEWNFMPKRPLKPRDAYESETEFQIAVARRLMGVEEGETFRGYDIYDIIKFDLWYGRNQELLAEVQEKLGFDFKQVIQELHPDWDYLEFLVYIAGYLEAKVRDNGMPKRCILDAADWEYNKQHQEEVLRILREVGKGETYKGFDISILVDLLKEGKLEDYAKVFNNMIGVDIRNLECLVDEDGKH